MKNEDEILHLLERYISQTTSKEECQRLFEALKNEKDSAKWEKAIHQIMEQEPADPGYRSTRWEPMILKILQKDRQQGKGHRSSRHWFTIARAAAAAVIFILGFGAWWGIQHRTETQAIATTELKNLKQDIRPGSNKAILTLANGQSITLDSMHKGDIALQGNAKVLKLNNGQLVYNLIKKGKSKEIFNTLETPSGGQYRITLPDGSKAWLNAASSIRFPTAFTGENREVFINGEVYFEIARNEAKPFIVAVNGMKVKVLGTHFNIMSYPSEPQIKTTLLEGAVEVTDGQNSTRLKPGQQASLDKKGDIRLIKDADISGTIAWTKGLFQFSDEGIAPIMRQISRWYNVDIVYGNGIPEGHITGKIPRNTNLSNVLKIMKLTGVHFKIEGRKVIVLNS